MMKTILVSLAILISRNSFGQSTIPENKEALAIGEIGGAMSWNLKGFAPSGGPSIAVECTPIENWLEIEAGATQSYHKGTSEWSIDLLFKKPYTLSKRVECMVGIGPEFSAMREDGVDTNEWGGELALDFMYWPFKSKRFGFYLEPGYDYSFAAGHQQSIGFSGGLLVSIN